MKLHADIRIQRQDIADLHNWLDRFAPGWLYWGSASSGELSAEETQHTRRVNDVLSANSVAKGRGDAWSTLKLVMPDKNAAMLVKLAWPYADVERPLQGGCDASKQPIGDRL